MDANTHRNQLIRTGQDGDTDNFAYYLAQAPAHVINSVDDVGNSLLHMLVFSPNSNWVCAQLLLKHIDFQRRDHRDNQKRTALDWAIQFDKKGVRRAIEETQ